MTLTLTIESADWSRAHTIPATNQSDHKGVHTNVDAFDVTAKSLSRNILHVNYLFSRFCEGHLSSNLRKSYKTIYFTVSSIKTKKQNFQANSLFFNILPINYLESIFYKENSMPA